MPSLTSLSSWDISSDFSKVHVLSDNFSIVKVVFVFHSLIKYESLNNWREHILFALVFIAYLA